MNKKQILQRVARNAEMLGLTVVSASDAQVVIDQAGTADNLVVACVDASIEKPMGGVDGLVSPFLGIGVANPGQISFKRSANGASLSALFATAEAVQVFSILKNFANDISVLDHTGAELLRVRGNVDLLGMGQ